MSRQFISTDEAIAMLPDTESVHTFRNPHGILIGADWERQLLVEHIKKSKPELTGETATNMGHGICIYDDHGVLFIATKKPAVIESAGV